MSRVERFEHRFVEFIPREVEPGVLYVSLEYATAVHLCACGCGGRVVTPLSPADWTLVFNGETVSLRPSVGNWSFACQSHYWVSQGVVRWAPKWSHSRIAANRHRALAGQQRRFREGTPPAGSDGTAPSADDGR